MHSSKTTPTATVKYYLEQEFGFVEVSEQMRELLELSDSTVLISCQVNEFDEVVTITFSEEGKLCIESDQVYEWVIKGLDELAILGYFP